MFQQLAVAVLLGLLVGVQREHAASGIAGMRTFPIITVLGSLSAMLATRIAGGVWIVAAGLLGVVAVTIVGHLLLPRIEREDREKETIPRDAHPGTEHGSIGAAVVLPHPGNGSATTTPTNSSGKSDLSSYAAPRPGTTTDMAMMLMFLVGAFLVVGPMEVAVVIGGGVAVLLQFKPELHRIAQKLGDEDLRAIMQFVLITCIILPVLPNQTYGPLNVLNPQEIWLMVALIVGLSLGGYIIYKFFGRSAGILLGGILGGAISSTATTVSYSRGMRGNSTGARTASIVIMIASTVMYLRVLLAVAVVSPDFLLRVLSPVSILMLLTLAPAMALWLRARRQPAPMPEQTNPTQLTSAVVFGVMYAVVLLALAVAKEYWNGQGLYAVAFISGLTEMDAVTLSTARMSTTDTMVATEGWRMILVAAMANMASKTCIAGMMGGWRLLVRILLLFAIPTLGGVALLKLW